MLTYDLSATRRLSASSLFSVAVHGLLIFGFIKTGALLNPAPLLPKHLDVTLSRAQEAEDPALAFLNAETGQNGELSAVPAVDSRPLTPQNTAQVLNTQSKTRFVATPRYKNEAALAKMNPALQKRRTISAATHAASDAAYLAWWRDRIEHVGTQLYRKTSPSAAFSGELRMLVAINRQGELLEVQIRRSSGNAALDQLAVDTVKKASPFKPLPDAMQDTDVLEIIRTWRFYAPTGEFVSSSH